MNGSIKDIARLFRFGLAIFTGCAIVLAGALLLHHQQDFHAPVQFDWSNIIIATVFQGLVLLITILEWQKNIALHGMQYRGFRECATHVGIAAIGKYAPGKILGAVARGAALYEQEKQPKAILMASLMEQVAVIHSGALIAITLLAYSAAGAAYAAIAILAGSGTLLFVRYLRPSVNWLLARIKRPLELLIDESEFSDVRSYATIFIYIAVIWLASAAGLYYCLATFAPVASLPPFADVLLINTVAYVLGFAAVFAPAGIGVRDGVIVALLLPYMDASIAISVAALHRVIVLLLDILIGLFSLTGTHIRGDNRGLSDKRKGG